MTHDELVKRAVKWLKGTARCGVAVPELVTYAAENPDAIGWKDHGETCVLIECKVSRSDFLSDKKKAVRKFPNLGAGNFRYYMTPKGLAKPEELPEKWGLLEISGKIIREIKKPIRFTHEACLQNSAVMMYSLLRRVEIRGSLSPCLSSKWRADGLLKSDA